MSSEARFYEFMGFDSARHRRARAFYLPFFEGCRSVLDIATGRGEFLDVLREAGIPASGVDLDPLMIRTARAAGHDVTEGDAFEFLRAREGAADGVFSAHFIEHLPSERVIELFALAVRALRPGGRFVVCTPNAASLPTLQRQFWWDATHVRMYDVDLLRFLAAEAGLVEVTGGVNPLNDPGCPIDVAALVYAPPPPRGTARAVAGLARRLYPRLSALEHQVRVLTDSLHGLVRELYVPSEIYVSGKKP